MIHSSYYQPRVYPYTGTGASAEIDRLQELTASVNLSREKINEIGRVDIVGWKEGIPQVSVTLRQLEYGTIEFWQKLANVASGIDLIDLDDFKTSAVDIAGYQTDDNGTFLGTVWYPNLRTSGFSLNIGDPDANIERSFTLVGEDQISFQGNNKYLIYLEATGGATSTFNVVIGSGGFSAYPTPIIDPDASGASYVIRVLRVRSGVTTELVEGTDFTFSIGTNTFAFLSNVTGDLYKVTYTATTYISGGDPFVENDTDATVLTADHVSIYLGAGNYVYRLQSVGIDVTFDRQDLKEIGNSEVVQRGVRNKTVRVTLGRILEDYTIEEVLRGAVADYGKIDVRNFADNITLIVKIYDSRTKASFLLGYKITNLAPTAIDAGTPTVDYVTQGVTLEAQEMTITNNESNL